MSASASRDSLPLAVAVVVPEGGQDALWHYPANGNTAVVAQEVTPGRGNAAKGFAVLFVFVVVIVASAMLMIAGSSDIEPFTESEPFAASCEEGNLEESLRALDASVVTDLDCEGTLGTISTELGKFTALTSLR
jgi:hypothetical protein